MKEEMLDENKEKALKGTKLPNDLLMKPFALGWTREVVRRVITKNGTPNCDIYYFSPSGKKIRSLTEIKTMLTDGLTPECFSFKKEPLGLNTTFETVRNARIRGKTDDKLEDKQKFSKSPKKAIKQELEEGQGSTNEIKKNQSEDDKEEPTKSQNEAEKMDINNGVEEEKGAKKPGEVKCEEKQAEEPKGFNNKKKTKTKTASLMKEKPNVRSRSLGKRREVLKSIMRAKQAKQAKVVASKKILKKIVKKTVARTPKTKLAQTKAQKETALKKRTANKKKVISKNTTKPVKQNSTKGKSDLDKNEINANENDKKSIARDLKSIVQKNIVKYREMREKQKLGAIKSTSSSNQRRITLGTISRVRSEPISKNKKFYLKPLEKGWRRELVFRTNSARAGQQADVYYFHPSGKKLRSCREISENLTHGLTIEYFTFRKEPLGCGEPSEVIRNARSHSKPIQPIKRREAEA